MSRVLLTGWFLIVLIELSCGQSYNHLEDYIAFRAQHQRYSGVTQIYKNDSLTFQSVSGFANRSYQVKNQKNTLFDLASVTKMFTAAGIAKLYDDGLVRLDTPFMVYYADFPLESAKNISVRQLLSHSSGISDLFFTDTYLRSDRSRLRKLKDYDVFYHDLEIAEIPEGQMQYSNTNFLILGRMIEKITGTGYYEFIQSNVFDPLQMDSTGFYEKDQIVGNLAKGYFVDPQASQEFGVPNDSMVRSNDAIRAVKGMPAGGAYSTAPDILRFIRGIQLGRLIKPATFKLFTSEINAGYALGFQKFERHGIQIWGHSGGFYGASTMVFHLPTKNLTFICLANSDFAAPPIFDRFINGMAGIKAENPIRLPATQLKRFNGFYEVYTGEMEGRQIEITAMQDHLSFDHALSFFPFGNEKFFDIDNDGFKLLFEVDSSGEVLGFIRKDDLGFFQKAKKISNSEVKTLEVINMSEEKLKEYILKFQFTGEGMMPGHIPKITVENGGLMIDNMMLFKPFQIDKFFLLDDQGMQLHFIRNENDQIIKIEVIRDNNVVGTLFPYQEN